MIARHTSDAKVFSVRIKQAGRNELPLEKATYFTHLKVSLEKKPSEIAAEAKVLIESGGGAAELSWFKTFFLEPPDEYKDLLKCYLRVYFGVNPHPRLHTCSSDLTGQRFARFAQQDVVPQWL